jgi:hypothetical protein
VADIVEELKFSPLEGFALDLQNAVYLVNHLNYGFPEFR